MQALFHMEARRRGRFNGRFSFVADDTAIRATAGYRVSPRTHATEG